MTFLAISNVDKKTEEILSYIAKKAGGSVVKEKKRKAVIEDDSKQDFIAKMEKIIKDIEKDFYAKKKNSHHKELRKRT